MMASCVVIWLTIVSLMLRISLWIYTFKSSIIGCTTSLTQLLMSSLFRNGEGESALEGFTVRFRPHSTGEVSTLSSFTGDRSESLSRMGVVLAECSMGMLVIGEVGSVVVIGEVGSVVVIGEVGSVVVIGEVGSVVVMGGLAITGLGGMERVTGMLSVGTLGTLGAGALLGTLSIGGLSTTGWLVTTGGLLRRWAALL